MIKKYVLIAICLLTFPGCACTRVPPGYVGIRVNMYGDQKGVDDYPLVTGRVWYNPMTEEIHSFPTFMQNTVWTKDNNEQSEDDESITFNSIEGAVLNADIALSYQILPEKVPHVFVEIRHDADYITDVYMRSKVRDSFSRNAATMKVVDIFGVKKQDLLTKVKDDLDKELKNKGFVIDMVSFVGGLRVDSQVEQSISATIQATQKAIEAQNKVAQSKAEAEQLIAEAEGKAKSIELEAVAKSEANKKLTESLSPELLQYEALQRWDGKMPSVIGENGAMPFISIQGKK